MASKLAPEAPEECVLRRCSRRCLRAWESEAAAWRGSIEHALPCKDCSIWARLSAAGPEQGGARHP
eukprot:5582125-Alexandrium_andersonii.AAC.1